MIYEKLYRLKQVFTYIKIKKPLRLRQQTSATLEFDESYRNWTGGV